ncbi:prolyl-tRNA synthetase associated domain-containing protein [Roseibium sp. RKSG952]|uniref:prolyl-tRNA synthetase associated domain-containing protein n=1 Tax=Roseibium sp. RKSG952 TaxID=2529384 RepID=UPI0012BD3C2E|nr:prolyl-tRNA synthetase associated domain-containing protein [Roseibium sp. RKSG952]MTH97812.1 prolyl-tRNA synthetase associated domain-containing protein [Roseibium sp. RKSG952]
MPASRADLLDFLADLGIPVRTVDHQPVFTVAESGDLHQRIPGGHTKNLFVKDKKGRLFLVVALHDAVIDLKKLHQIVGAQGRVSFGNADLLMETLGVVPGSVTPFSLINDREDHKVTPVFDAAMMQHEILNFHPLSNDATTSIASADLLRFAENCGHQVQVLAVSQDEGAGQPHNA